MLLKSHKYRDLIFFLLTYSIVGSKREKKPIHVLTGTIMHDIEVCIECRNSSRASCLEGKENEDIGEMFSHRIHRFAKDKESFPFLSSAYAYIFA